MLASMEKVNQRWTCESCHNECVTVAWRTREPESLDPVEIRARCAVCGNISARSFRPGTDPNTDETYTIEEWTKRGETERASRHLVEGAFHEEPEVAGKLTAEEVELLESKVRQCLPPHLASTWNLVPPVNEWYATDVPRLLAEVRRLHDDNVRLRGELAILTLSTRERRGKARV